ncbi:MAG: hypothetical protein PHT02_14940 [Tissierellia bacterium]|nr:hypothetical protein [Tissierellia bacterium]
MIIEHQVETIFPIESFNNLKLLNKHIEIIPTYALNEVEAKKLEVSLLAVERQLIIEKFNSNNLPKARMFLTKDGTITYKLPKKVLGNCTPYWIVYAIENWRELDIQDNRLITIFTEEMCHCFWQEFDELKVKHIVLRVLKNIDIYKNALIEQIYNL